MKKLSHINDKGEANMVAINNKKESKREAAATGTVILSKKAINEIKKEKISKGNVLNTARIAGIMAAKKTSDLIPLCHPIPVEAIKIDFDIEDNNINVLAIVSTSMGIMSDSEARMKNVGGEIICRVF